MVSAHLILPLYKDWGVRGLKFGFVDGMTQKGLTWLASAIKKVNDYGFILDIKDDNIISLHYQDELPLTLAKL